MKKIFIICILIILGINTFVLAQDLSIAEKTIYILASDEMEGRFPGTEQDIKSIDFIETMMMQYSLKSFKFGYQQSFNLLTDIKASKECNASISKGKPILDLELGKDYMPFNFSAEKSLDANIVVLENIADTSVHLNQEWLLYYLPAQKKVLEYRDLINIALEAQNRNAGGLIIVSETHLSKDGEFYPFDYNRSVSSLGIPVIQINKNTLLSILKDIGYKGKGIKNSKEFIETDCKNLSLNSNISIDKTYSKTANIVGYVKAKSSSEWIVIGAHYDHLGWGGENSGSRTPKRNEIHNGADDNASGVGMVLLLAEYYANNPPSCNIIFVLFAAEEQGLIGSKYFVENSPISIEKIKVMVNFDMLGRLSDSTLSIIGTTTANEFNTILKPFNNKPLKLKLGGGGYSGSDQASFYSEKIPVLFFSTGMHKDYHTPDDDIEFINFDGMLDIAKLAIQVIDKISDNSTILTYNQQKQEQNQRHGGEMKVKLGIMPDMTSKEGSGLGIDGVTNGGIADKAGIKKGDVLIMINDKKVSGIYEYMNLLSEIEPGQKVKAIVIRNSKEIKFDIQF